MLAGAIDAREVSFLIADFSGQSLIRLGHAGAPPFGYFLAFFACRFSFNVF